METKSAPTAVTWEAIQAAHARIAPRIHRAPILTSASLDAMIGARVFFKCENLQKTGSFKIRGASNAIFSLTDDEVSPRHRHAIERQSRSCRRLRRSVARRARLDRDAEEFLRREAASHRRLRRPRSISANPQ